MEAQQKLQSRTETQILLEMIQDANKKGLIQASQETLEKIEQGRITSNQYIMDFSVHSKPLSELEQENENNYNNININTATGQALDNFGNLHNIPRITASPAYVDVLITIPVASGEDVVIPAGTKVLIESVANVGEYVTSEEIILAAGVESVTGRAESVNYGYQNNLLIGALQGIDGFPTLDATNEAEGTHGRNIEEDDDYRIRVMDWMTINERGSGDAIKSYLESYNGLNGYALIPLYDGVGTLKVICDTLQTELENISEGLHKNAMLETDPLPLCVLPDNLTLNNLTIDINISNLTSGLTNEELKQLVIAQTRTFVDGGFNRNGMNIKGMNIGADFVPGQLIHFLLSQITEISNIILSEQSIIPVPAENKFKIETITVNIL